MADLMWRLLLTKFEVLSTNCTKIRMRAFSRSLTRRDIIEGTSGPWACPSSRQREKMSRTDPLCPIAHAACPARQRRMVQFIGSHSRACRLPRTCPLAEAPNLVPSMYNISMRSPRFWGRDLKHWNWRFNIAAIFQ